MRATFFVLGLIAAAAQAAPQPADLIVHDARIHTVDATHPQVVAMAVRDGRIVFVGSEREAMSLRGAKTRLLDLDGKTVIPGMIDAHAHLLGLGQGLQTIDLRGTTSYDAVIAKVFERRVHRERALDRRSRLGPERLGRYTFPGTRGAERQDRGASGVARTRRWSCRAGQCCGAEGAVATSACSPPPRHTLNWVLRHREHGSSFGPLPLGQYTSACNGGTGQHHQPPKTKQHGLVLFSSECRGGRSAHRGKRRQRVGIVGHQRAGHIFLFWMSKKMRIHVCILPDPTGKGLLSTADAAASVARAKALIKSKFDVKVSGYGNPSIQELKEQPPGRAYDLEGDGSGYWTTEYGAAGRYFAKYTAGRVGIPITVVHPITVFVVHTVTSNGESWRGASFGLTADYVVLTPTGMNDDTTLTHELGQACNLLHRKKKANLMKHSHLRGTNITGWQKWWFRQSRHVDFW